MCILRRCWLFVCALIAFKNSGPGACSRSAGRAVFALVLSLFCGLSFSETIPATVSTTPHYNSDEFPSITGLIYTDAADAACRAKLSAFTNVEYQYFLPSTSSAGLVNVTCRYLNKSFNMNDQTFTTVRIMTFYECPDSSWTLQGDTCVKDDCPDGYVFVYGQCRKECEQLQSRSEENPECHCSESSVSMANQVGTFRSGDGAIPDSICIGGCSFGTGDAVGGGGWWAGYASQPTYQVCTGDATEIPVLDTNKPPCGSGQGVMTSSTGSVLCVPEGTPTARQPDVEVQKKKETYSDGSEATTEKTTTTDPATGAEHVSESRTSSGGMAGAEGTTTSESETSNGTGEGEGEGTCEGDDCDDGSEPFRRPDGDGFYTPEDEKTFKSVLDEYQNKVSEAPFISAAKNWLVISNISGSCGGLVATIPLVDVTLSLDEYFCGPGANSIINMAGAVVLILAAFLAWRIAFLD